MNLLPDEKMFEIWDALSGGASIREIALIVGVSKGTVLSYRKIWLSPEVNGTIPDCPCGMSGGHKGWCKFRFHRSECRQRTLAEMHQKQRN